MKYLTAKRLGSIAAGSVLFFLLGAFVVLPSPIETVNICIQYGWLAFLSVACGPLTGALGDAGGEGGAAAFFAAHGILRGPELPQGPHGGHCLHGGKGGGPFVISGRIVAAHAAAVGRQRGITYRTIHGKSSFNA